MADDEPPAGESEGEEIEDEEAEDEFDDNKALCRPIYMSGGRKYGFFPRGLCVTTKKSLMSRRRRLVIAWDSFRKCDMEWTCWTGYIRLVATGGRKIDISSWSWRIREAGQVVHDQMNTGDALDEENDETLAKLRGQARILNHGIIIRHRNIFTCSGRSTFVPWESVVSASLVQGCMTSFIFVSTLLEAEKQAGEAPKPLPKITKIEEKRDKDGKKVPLTDEEKQQLEKEADEKAAALPPPPSFITVTLRGYAGKMDDVFKLLTKLMSGGKEDKEAEGAPSIRRATITEAGVLFTSGLCLPELDFLPWNSITAVDWASEFFVGGHIILTDRCGTQRKLPGVNQEEYLQFRGIYSNAVDQTDGDDDTKPIVRRHLRLMSDGVSVTQRHFCSSKVRFYPWAIVDAAEMDVTCCGGSLKLVTEAGERIPVWRASIFTQGKMVEIWKRIREMKYQLGQEPDAGNPRYFAGREGNPRAAMLTDKDLKITSKTGPCQKTIRVVDLEAITACKVVKGEGCCARWTLHIYLDEKMAVGMSEKEVKTSGAHNKLAAEEGDDMSVHSLVVRLLHTDAHEDIRADIMNRSAKRKNDLS